MLKVTCAIIVKNNRILITQLGENSDHPNQWEFPGGKIENIETPENCIVREIQEELNIKVKIVHALKEVVHNYGSKQITLIPFICSIEKGEISLINHVDYKWINSFELDRTDFLAADKKLIQHKENRIFLKECFGE